MTLTTGKRRAGRPSDSGSIQVPLCSGQDSSAQVTLTSGRPANGGGQWSYNFRQYAIAVPAGLRRCQVATAVGRGKLAGLAEGTPHGSSHCSRLFRQRCHRLPFPGHPEWTEEETIWRHQDGHGRD